MSTATAQGLTAAEVLERVERGQTNDVPTSPSRTTWQIVRANVFTRFNAIVGSMLVLILTVGPIQDALFGFVLIANAVIGIYQELRAKRTLDRLAVLTAPRARVVRDGEVREVPVDQIVLDDVLELALGAQVPVDGSVVNADGLEIDESLLTGESDPVDKRPGDVVRSGSFVAAGNGRFRATAVGSDAYAVRLAVEARRFTKVRSELRDGINRLLTYVTWAIIPTGTLLFVSQLRHDASVADGLRGAVAGVVAMVPEGLVLLTSIAFAVGVRRLAQHRVLVQELPAVEGLARVDIVCVDKTGTLTEGRLSVDEVVALDGADPAEALAALAASERDPNATLLAIKEHFSAPVGDGWRAMGTVPFSSARKWSAAAFADHGTWVLGAPEIVAPSDDDVATRTRALAQEGKRVVLLARTTAALGEATDGVPAALDPVALVALSDRPRADAADTLAYFGRQDVTVKVISGDNPETVGAIAREVGVPGADRVVDARTLPDGESDGDPGALADALEDASIFGRVSPQQKRAMVKALQSRGHVVAMTGDGVNDALALKDADLGIAMGSGSEATRAVAQLVLLDSNFDALPSVVDEGRRVLGNIERTSNLYVTKTTYAMLLSLAVGVLGMAFPFLPRHLTLIGAITIGIPSFFLALAPNTERTQPGFLHRVLRFSIPAGFLAALATFLGYALALSEPGINLAEAQTTATMVLTWVGLLILALVAAPLNRWKLALIWSMAAIGVAAIVLPPTRWFFALDPPEAIVWLAAIGIAAIVWSFARLLIPHPPGDSGAPMMQ